MPAFGLPADSARNVQFEFPPGSLLDRRGGGLPPAMMPADFATEDVRAA